MTTPDPDPAATIHDDFPHWRAWTSQTDRWWAIRDTALSAGQVRAGCLPLLHAEDREHLVRRIQEQETLRDQHPVERMISATISPAGRGGRTARLVTEEDF